MLFTPNVLFPSNTAPTFSAPKEAVSAKPVFKLLLPNEDLPPSTPKEELPILEAFPPSDPTDTDLPADISALINIIPPYFYYDSIDHKNFNLIIPLFYLCNSTLLQQKLSLIN